MKYLPYVNIKMGTKSHIRRSHGNTLPLTQRPFGMASFCPQTEGKSAWFFQPDHEFLEGIRLTHQPSPWIGDYGTFLITPQNDVIAKSAENAWSGYRIKDSVMRPDYMSVTFLRSNCRLELTPTERGGMLRLTFNDTRPSFLSILPIKGKYTYTLNEEGTTLLGTTDGHSQDSAKNFKMYFAIQLPRGAIDIERTYFEGEGENACAHIALKERKLEARIGISYISHELALNTIKRECTSLSFDELRLENEVIWEERLHRIEIETDNEERMKTFYSCLYRTFLFPHKAYELDENGEAIHYSPADGTVHAGVRYTDNGFWDTYRTVYPLFTLIAREEYKEMLEGFVNDYKEGGWLPRWISIGEVGCMPSTLIDAVILEAASNGISTQGTLNLALDGMLRHAREEAPAPRYGRNGVLSYIKYGYVPSDEYKESVNLTLDAAYGDWCIARLAEILGRDELTEEFMARSKSYKNLFDKSTGFMRGRKRDGTMSEPFDPSTWGGDYTEASAWQSSFAVPHDIDGLCELYGGKDELIKKLDALFNEKPSYRVFGYGGEIHEMTEMALCDFGQMAISNQPSFHIPYIYVALGEEPKASKIIERLVSEAFSSTEKGYPGDEDNGTMSAWYILSCLGMYRLTPGKSEWVYTKRLVNKIKILGKEI